MKKLNALFMSALLLSITNNSYTMEDKINIIEQTSNVQNDILKQNSINKISALIFDSTCSKEKINSFIEKACADEYEIQLQRIYLNLHLRLQNDFLKTKEIKSITEEIYNTKQQLLALKKPSINNFLLKCQFCNNEDDMEKIRNDIDKNSILFCRGRYEHYNNPSYWNEKEDSTSRKLTEHDFRNVIFKRNRNLYEIISNAGMEAGKILLPFLNIYFNNRQVIAYDKINQKDKAAVFNIAVLRNMDYIYLLVNKSKQKLLGSFINKTYNNQKLKQYIIECSNKNKLKLNEMRNCFKCNEFLLSIIDNENTQHVISELANLFKYQDSIESSKNNKSDEYVHVCTSKKLEHDMLNTVNNNINLIIELTNTKNNITKNEIKNFLMYVFNDDMIIDILCNVENNGKNYYIEEFYERYIPGSFLQNNKKNLDKYSFLIDETIMNIILETAKLIQDNNKLYQMSHIIEYKEKNNDNIEIDKNKNLDDNNSQILNDCTTNKILEKETNNNLPEDKEARNIIEQNEILDNTKTNKILDNKEDKLLQEVYENIDNVVMYYVNTDIDKDILNLNNKTNTKKGKKKSKNNNTTTKKQELESLKAEISNFLKDTFKEILKNRDMINLLASLPDDRGKKYVAEFYNKYVPEAKLQKYSYLKHEMVINSILQIAQFIQNYK